MVASLTLPTFAPPISHPARYTPALLHVIAQYLKPEMWVLDPFGGVGTLHKLSFTGAKIVTGELEYRVCEHSAGVRRVCSDAQALPFASHSFDAVVTSPTYGNRMADNTQRWTANWTWNTYDASFGFELHPSNSGGMHWGEAYRELHRKAYRECFRVLRPRAEMIVNVSDHIRKHQRVYVSKWHFETLRGLGLRYQMCHAVKTPRFTYGANAKARCPVEYIFVFQKP